jgi:hypothetical protein
VKALEDGLNAMRPQAQEGYSATFKPGDKKWQWLNNGLYIVRIDLDDMKPKGNGTELNYTILNTISVPLRNCKISVAWSSTDSSGAVIPTTAHGEQRDIDDTLEVGRFTPAKMILQDLPPDKIGSVTLSGLECTHTGSV